MRINFIKRFVVTAAVLSALIIPATATAQPANAATSAAPCVTQVFAVSSQYRNCVAILQGILRESNLVTGTDYGYTVADGIFGGRTKQLVLRFQGKWSGTLAQDGIVGPATWSKLCLPLPGQSVERARSMKAAGC